MGRIKGFFGVNFITMDFYGEDYIVSKHIIVHAQTLVEAVEAAKKWYREEKQAFSYQIIDAKYLEIIY